MFSLLTALVLIENQHLKLLENEKQMKIKNSNILFRQIPGTYNWKLLESLLIHYIDCAQEYLHKGYVTIWDGHLQGPKAGLITSNICDWGPKDVTWNFPPLHLHWKRVLIKTSTFWVPNVHCESTMEKQNLHYGEKPIHSHHGSFVNVFMSFFMIHLKGLVK